MVFNLQVMVTFQKSQDIRILNERTSYPVISLVATLHSAKHIAVDAIQAAEVISQ